LDALCSGLDCTREDLRGLTVDVLGAGGAARAIVAGLMDYSCAVTVYNRTAAAGTTLAAVFGCRAAPWEDRLKRDGQAVINCTRLGMAPHADETPLPPDSLDDRPLVFDTVYNPIRTRLLDDANAVGCRTVDGVEMFVRQAAAQYRVWFDEAADVAAMREWVRHALETDPTGST
jgi:3-dehydroquinate dehydratase/shikimate dehydrogenase